MAGIEADSSEGPSSYVWVRFRSDPADPFTSMFGNGRTFTPNVELTDEEEAELKELHDRWNAWRHRLRKMLGED
jgi:hypothetical protein